MDEFQNSWEISLDIKISYFNSLLSCSFNSHGVSVSNVSVKDVGKNIYTAPSIEGRYYVYIYDGKLVMHILAHFDLP